MVRKGTGASNRHRKRKKTGCAQDASCLHERRKLKEKKMVCAQNTGGETPQEEIAKQNSKEPEEVVVQALAKLNCSATENTRQRGKIAPRADAPAVRKSKGAVPTRGKTRKENETPKQICAEGKVTRKSNSNRKRRRYNISAEAGVQFK